MNGETQLLEVIGALGTPGCLASGLDGREKQRDQYRDNSDDDQKLDQRETRSSAHGNPRDE